MNKDHLYEIMTHLNIIELYHFCKVSKDICKDLYFWKLKNQYDHIKDENIITLDYIMELVNIILNLNTDIIHIGLPEHRDYQELHDILKINIIPTVKTYNDIIIKKLNQHYELKYEMTNSITHHIIFKYKTIINKQKLAELLMYLLYIIDDYRYYTKQSSNYHL